MSLPAYQTGRLFSYPVASGDVEPARTPYGQVPFFVTVTKVSADMADTELTREQQTLLQFAAAVNPAEPTAQPTPKAIKKKKKKSENPPLRLTQQQYLALFLHLLENHNDSTFKNLPAVCEKIRPHITFAFNANHVDTVIRGAEYKAMGLNIRVKSLGRKTSKKVSFKKTTDLGSLAAIVLALIQRLEPSALRTVLDGQYTKKLERIICNNTQTQAVKQVTTADIPGRRLHHDCPDVGPAVEIGPSGTSAVPAKSFPPYGPPTQPDVRVPGAEYYGPLRRDVMQAVMFKQPPTP